MYSLLMTNSAHTSVRVNETSMQSCRGFSSCSLKEVFKSEKKKTLSEAADEG